MDPIIRQILAEVPELRDQPVEVTPLGGGLTNRNFRLTSPAGDFVLRIAGEGTEHLGIDRTREVTCSRAAAEAGVGPAVIAYLPAHRALVCAFVPGKLLTQGDVRQPGILARIGQTLRRCHDHPPPAGLGAFCPFTTIRGYRGLAATNGVPLPATLDSAMTLLDRIEAETATDEARCLCHNDLLASNFIDTGAQMRIIDWEYGGLGDRFFDLGNFAVNHQLSADEEQELLTAYLDTPRPHHRRRLRLMRLVSDLREATWGFVQASVSKLHEPAYYLEYGQKHLDRFLADSSDLRPQSRVPALDHQQEDSKRRTSALGMGCLPVLLAAILGGVVGYVIDPTRDTPPNYHNDGLATIFFPVVGVIIGAGVGKILDVIVLALEKPKKDGTDTRAASAKRPPGSS
jgi:thiamine kinase-like enzyme